MSATPQTAPVSGTYYPYIDGLRALAVLSVLIFHLHGPWLPGGFVGVDVFFVISGFVVSASLANLHGAGLWTLLSHFYARRIKRIFPALIVCLLLTTLVATLFIPLSWLSVVNQQTGLYAFFGLSNFILAQTGRDYFAPTTEFNPYTHTWSLAVEEQFYLIFPFLFLGWLGSGRGRQWSVWLLAGGLVLSIALAAWQTHYSPTQAYFLSPGRFWELAAGVLLYQLSVLKPEAFQLKAGLRLLLGCASLLLVLGAFIWSSAAGFPFPGALPAVLGTLGLMYALHGQAEPRPLHRLLGCKPLVQVGKISYSLYLWHWPVFVLFRWTYGLDSPWLRLLAVLLAFLLAIASWRWVETPVRQARIVRRMPQSVVVLCGLLVVAGAWWGAARMTQNPFQLSLSTLSAHQEVWYPHGWPTNAEYPGCTAEPAYHNVGDGTLMIYSPQGCEKPRPLQVSNLFVIGDSHAIAYEGLFKQFAITQSTRIYAYNNGGCPFISFQPWRDIDNIECRRHADAALKDMRARIKPGDTLFLPSLRLPRFSDQWAYFGDEGAYQQMFSKEAHAGRQHSIEWAVPVLREFAAQGVRIIFEAPKPLFKAPPFRCADWFNQYNPICKQGFDMPRAQLEQYREPVLQAFAELAHQVSGIEVWDPFPVLCPESVCHAWQEGQPLFLDGDHLSGLGNMKLLSNFVVYMQAGSTSKTGVAHKPQTEAPTQENGHDVDQD